MNYIRNLIVRGLLISAIVIGAFALLSPGNASAQNVPTCNQGQGTLLNVGRMCTFKTSQNQHMIEVFAPFSTNQTGAITITGANSCDPGTSLTLNQASSRQFALCNTATNKDITVSYDAGGTIPAIVVTRT